MQAGSGAIGQRFRGSGTSGGPAFTGRATSHTDAAVARPGPVDAQIREVSLLFDPAFPHSGSVAGDDTGDEDSREQLR